MEQFPKFLPKYPNDYSASGLHLHRSAHRGIVKEDPCHVIWQTDTSVGICNPGEKAGVHPDSGSKLHKPWHRGTLEMGPFGWLVLFGVYILNDHIPGSIHKVAVEVGGVFLFLFADLELTYRGVMPLLPSGNSGDPNQLA